MATIRSFLPKDINTLLALDRADLAVYGLLRYLNHVSQDQPEMFHRDNLCRPTSLLDYPAEHRENVSSALMEAWTWLQRETNYLAPAPSIGQWERLTNEGKGSKEPFDWEATKGHSPLLSMLGETLWVLESEDEDEMRQGTGFMLEGVGVVTCAHVLLKRCEAFRHDNPDKKYQVEVLQQDENRDLAILRIRGGGEEVSGKALTRAQNSPMPRYEQVRVVGFPNYRRNDSIMIHTGQISGSRTWGCERRLLLDARIVVGMSGGPVRNWAGQVVGIAVTGTKQMGTTDETEDHGAIPIDALERIGQSI